MKARIAGVVSAIGLLGGCFLRRQEAAVAPAQPAHVATATDRIVVGDTARASSVVDSVAEPRVDLEMVNAPVKLVLQKLAEIGGLELIIPPNLNRTLSVQYVRVPVSLALADVLSRSGLRLGPAAVPNMPFDTATVFYRLPANIDSLSVDAIVRRFGVSRALATLIVNSRRP